MLALTRHGSNCRGNSRRAYLFSKAEVYSEGWSKGRIWDESAVKADVSKAKQSAQNMAERSLDRKIEIAKIVYGIGDRTLYSAPLLGTC
jgi:hypothetical protein